MNTNLKLVEAEPELTPARVTLARAIADRDALNEQYLASGAARDKLNGLIRSEAAAQDAVMKLEKEAAEAAGAWARGKSATLESPGQEEIDVAKKNLEMAIRQANAARAALPEIDAEQRGLAPARQEAHRRVLEAQREVELEGILPLAQKLVEARRAVNAVETEIESIGSGITDLPGEMRGHAQRVFETRKLAAIETARGM